MSDNEFLGYVESHCRTERALFNSGQIRRLYELAHMKPPYLNGWYSMGVNVAQPLVDLARKSMEQEKKLKNLLA